jgi:hypothetical protein
MTIPTTGPTTLLLLDPTSIDGESGLAALGAADDHVALITLISGRTSSALREFAHAEEVDLLTAAWIYLDQVVARAEAPGRQLETILIDGSDLARELVDLTATTTVRRVIMPASLERLYPAHCARVRAAMPAPVLVVSTPLPSHID